MEIRNPTSDDLSKSDPEDAQVKGFTPLVTTSGRVYTPTDLFEQRLGKEVQIAAKEHKPFAEIVARDDYKQKLDDWNKSFKRQGYASTKKPTFEDIDWKKYSDLKNFEHIDSGEQLDQDLSKLHKVPVYIKWKKYQYKGYKNAFIVMEEPNDALTRALDSLENRKVRTTK